MQIKCYKLVDGENSLVIFNEYNLDLLLDGGWWVLFLCLMAYLLFLS